MKFINEFKEFAVKGNMIDMAIGIIIGAAFKNVVDVIVKKVIMPPLTLLTDGIEFQERKITLREASVVNGEKITEVSVHYGELVEVFIDFLIISMVIFMVVKFMNSLKKKAEDPKNKKVATPKDIQLLQDVKELLEEQNKLLSTPKE